jgi:hypothetical protein
VSSGNFKSKNGDDALTLEVSSGGKAKTILLLVLKAKLVNHKHLN